jgi:hypothetical protein
MSYLSKRSDLLAMDVSVASVSFQQDEATAQVHFQAKGNSSPAAGMTMQYVLERKDGQWVVKGRPDRTRRTGPPGVNSVPGQGFARGAGWNAAHPAQGGRNLGQSAAWTSRSKPD